MSVDWAESPGHTVVVGSQPAKYPKDGARAHDTGVAPQLLLVRNTATYTNGFDVAGAADASGKLYLCDIQARHTRSTTPYDKTSTYLAGDNILSAELEIGRDYHFKSGTLSCAIGDALISAANGLVVNAQAYTTSLALVNTFVAIEAKTSVTSVKATFVGREWRATAA